MMEGSGGGGEQSWCSADEAARLGRVEKKWRGRPQFLALQGWWVRVQWLLLSQLDSSPILNWIHHKKRL